MTAQTHVFSDDHVAAGNRQKNDLIPSHIADGRGNVSIHTIDVKTPFKDKHYYVYARMIRSRSILPNFWQNHNQD